MNKTAYLLDSNVLIDSSRRYYGFELCPGFWNALLLHHNAHRVYSIDQVKKEILKYKDRLTQWVKDDIPEKFFLESDVFLTTSAYQEIIRWVYEQPQYYESAKTDFTEKADSWLVAYAKAHDMTIVTHENNSTTAKKRVLIPMVCKQFDVPCVTLFDMLNNLKVQFILNES